MLFLFFIKDFASNQPRNPLNLTASRELLING